MTNLYIHHFDNFGIIASENGQVLKQFPCKYSWQLESTVNYYRAEISKLYPKGFVFKKIEDDKIFETIKRETELFLKEKNLI